MEDISNKTLAILVVIAIIVSFVALFVVVGKFRIIKTAGMASQTGGNITLTVETDINIIATDNSITFGNMLPETWNNSEQPGYDDITVQNIGATTVDIDYWANRSIFVARNGTAGFEDIALTGACTGNYSDICAEDEAYKIKILDDGTCQAFGSTGTWCSSPDCVSTTDYEDVTIRDGVADSNGLRDLIGYCQTNNEFTIGIHVHVPEFEPSGSKTSTLNFRAQQFTP